MTSGEYLKQLEKYLRKLPQSDYEDAMEYFTEYFADAGPENEQAVIKELGTPKQAAAELMRNLLDKKVDEREAMEKEEKQKEKKKTTGANVVWIAILALFAAPIGAPILISILIVLLCAALCAALLDMSVFLIAVVGVAAGIKMLRLRGDVLRDGGACADVSARHSGSLGFLRRILLYYRNGRFHAGNQYSVRGVRRILCKMDGTAVRVVYT